MQTKNKEFTSIVRRTNCPNIIATVPGIGSVKRNVIVFENVTDNEIDVYVSLEGIYKDYYFQIKHFTSKERMKYFRTKLEDYVREMVKLENSGMLETDNSLKALFCEKYYIA